MEATESMKIVRLSNIHSKEVMEDHHSDCDSEMNSEHLKANTSQTGTDCKDQ
jgi:hypothetical protein